MAGLQRSAVSFRRQGSSGLVWDDKVLSGELVQLNHKEEGQRQRPKEGEEEKHEKAEMREMKTARTVGSIHTIDRNRSSGGGRGYRTGKVSPATEPPSPKLSACGFCGAFGRREDKVAAHRKRKTR